MKKFVLISVILSIGLIAIIIRHNKIEKREASIECEDCNIIVISLSNLRKKNMSFYGSPRNTTPIIDQYFKNSFSFDHAIAPASLTFSDAASFFYSLHTLKHQFMNRSDRDKTAEILKDHVSLPKILKTHGYKTAAFVSDEDYKFENGFGSQFDLYFDKSFYEANNIIFQPWQYNVGTKDLVKPAIKWLRENHQDKFFLFLQAYDMHCPYTPRGKFLDGIQGEFNSKIDFSACYITLDKVEEINKKIGKDNKHFFKLYNWESFLNKETDQGTYFEKRDIDHLVDLYDAELSDADHNLAEFFNEIKNLNLEKNTIIVFMSEHGDYLGESGYFMKVAVTGKGNLHNANLSYPLMINYPPLKGPRRQKQMIQTIDLAPTFLEMLGVSVPEGMQGKSFLKMLGNDTELNDYAFSAAIRKRNFKDKGQFDVQALQNREWKYNFYEHRDFDNKIIESEENLYNLVNDPDETNDLVNKELKELQTMREVIKQKRIFYAK